MVYDDLFRPQGVAVFGSVKPGKLANVLMHRLVEGGRKDIYAVNPRGQGVEDLGIPGYASVLEVEAPVSLAIIAAPAPTVKDVLEDCGRKGIKAAAIITSGFSEAGNREGEKEILAVAEKYGIRFVGPNCAGIVSTQDHLLATLETRPPEGNIAIISQSGAVGGTLMAMAKAQGLGISKFVSFGNGLDLNMLEFLEWMKEDENTKVVAVYLESVRNGRAFLKTLSELVKIKPVIVVKAGRSSAGSRAALSHTGSMAGADGVFDAALRQCGAIRAMSLEEMFDIAKAFALLPPMNGKRLLIVTNSGGPGVMATDRSEELGLSMPEPSPAMKEKLYSFLPSFASVKNPLDLTVEGTGEQYKKAITTALDEYDAALVLYIGTPYLKAMPIAEGIVRAAKAVDKPIAATLLVGSDIPEAEALLDAEGIPQYVSGERAVAAFQKMAAYSAKKASGIELAAPPAGSRAHLPAHLLEPEAKALLRDQGIAVQDFRFVHSAEEAAAEGEQLGWPIVMKIVSPQILHKSDVGGVLLGIRSREEAIAAYHQLERIGAGKDFRGAILSKMLKGSHELIIGLLKDASFGPVIAFGMGGIYTEVLKDVVFRVAPVSKAEAKEMIGSIKAHKILEGVRGEPPVDTDKLAEMIASASMLPFRYDNFKEMDLNPVFADAHGAVAIDARILTDE
jgi:acyl-CoA synthetase (NDP forming)